MISISKKTDYALLALTHLALSDEGQPIPARDIAGEYEIPAELLAKILQKLARSGLLKSSPGPTGGYTLARPAETITIGAVLEAVEGTPALAHCMRGHHSDCEQVTRCTIRRPLERINARVLTMLDDVPLSDFVRDLGKVRTSSPAIRAIRT